MKLFITSDARPPARGHASQRTREGARPGAPLAADAEGRRMRQQLAAAEKIDRSCLCRVLRLTLLAPEIVEAVMDGRQEGVTLPALMKGLPVAWARQGSNF